MLQDSDPEAYDESGPWCVDQQGGIRCLTTIEVWKKLASGQLSAHDRVWRAGRAGWQMIAEVPSLTDGPDPAELEEELYHSHPEVSELALQRWHDGPEGAAVQRSLLRARRLSWATCALSAVLGTLLLAFVSR